MKIKQISVFVENTSGRIAYVSEVLFNAGVNLRAISVADTNDFGILRIIPEQPKAAMTALKEAGLTAKITEVIGVEIGDTRGGLYNIMKTFRDNNVNIEYLYSSLETEKAAAVIIFKVEDIDHGLQIAAENGLKTISAF